MDGCSNKILIVKFLQNSYIFKLKVEKWAGAQKIFFKSLRNLVGLQGLYFVIKFSQRNYFSRNSTKERVILMYLNFLFKFKLFIHLICASFEIHSFAL